MIFSLTTFNVGLLEIFGGLYRPVPFVGERLRALPDALVNLGSDVIALQEIYSDVHRRYLSSEVREVYPFYAPLQRDRVHGLENGLMTQINWSGRVDLNHRPPGPEPVCQKSLSHRPGVTYGT